MRCWKLSQFIFITSQGFPRNFPQIAPRNKIAHWFYHQERHFETLDSYENACNAGILYGLYNVLLYIINKV